MKLIKEILVNLELTKRMSVELPTMPNFLKVSETFGENGIKDHTVSVIEFTDQQLREIGKNWTEALVEHAKEKREKSQPQLKEK